MPAFWRGRRVLLTGHTGFKGAWLALWLRPPRRRRHRSRWRRPTAPSLFEAARVERALRQPHRSTSATRTRWPPSVRAARPRGRPPSRGAGAGAGRLSRAAGDLRDQRHGHGAPARRAARRSDGVRVGRRRHDRQGLPQRRAGLRPTAKTMRSAATIPTAPARRRPSSSRRATATRFSHAHGVAVATARAGNVIGGGDWSEDRLIPDAVRAWQAGAPLQVRRPDAVRPWQHVLEPLAGYLRPGRAALAREPALAGAYNFGPRSDEAASVGEVVAPRARRLRRRRVRVRTRRRRPARGGPAQRSRPRTRARALGSRRAGDCAEALAADDGWYRGLADGAGARALCRRADLDAYAPRRGSEPLRSPRRHAARRPEVVERRAASAMRAAS